MAVIALYVLLGTFLDEVSTILITVPVTLPLDHRHRVRRHLVRRLRHRHVHDRADQPADRHDRVRHPGAASRRSRSARIYLGTLPFLVADFVLVALLILMPALALWLPSVLY